MTATEREPFEARLRSETETYLDHTAACVECLPRLVDAYAADGDYEAVAGRIAETEGKCDETNRRVSALVGNADVRDLGIRLSRVHLHSGQTIDLYHALDEVANAAEQFADEMAAIRPERDPALLDSLAEMAALAVDAATALRPAVAGYLDALCDPEASVSIAHEVAHVRAVESECDRLRADLVASAFDGDASGTALVYRELATLLDGVVDAMEDVTDRMIRITGTELSIDVEPDADGESGI